MQSWRQRESKLKRRSCKTYANTRRFLFLQRTKRRTHSYGVYVNAELSARVIVHWLGWYTRTPQGDTSIKIQVDERGETGISSHSWQHLASFATETTSQC